MPKKNRLTGSEIRRMNPEKRLNSGLFSLSVSRRGDALSKIAVVVSKKVSTRAVGRNRVKRRMRAAIRDLSPLPSGFDFILVAKKSAAEAPLSEIRADLSALIARAA